MIAFYKILGINPLASSQQILAQYYALIAQHPPEKRINNSEFYKYNKAIHCIIGNTNIDVQFKTLLQLIKKISTFDSYYLLYDEEQFNKDGVAIFDAHFYAHGEIVKFFQQLDTLLNNYKSTFASAPECLLPCLNVMIDVIQSLYCLDHYDDSDNLHPYAGLYTDELEIIDHLFSEIRPELLPLNKLLLQNNAGKKSSVAELKSSVIPDKIERIEQAFRKIFTTNASNKRKDLASSAEDRTPKRQKTSVSTAESANTGDIEPSDLSTEVKNSRAHQHRFFTEVARTARPSDVNSTPTPISQHR